MNLNKQNTHEEELNFKELLKNPIRLYGWVFVLFFSIILLLGIYFVLNLNQISFNQQAVGVADTVNIKKEIELKKGSISPSVDLKMIKTPSAEFINKGKTLYETACKSCHGEKGLGDGPAGMMLNPKPRNFSTTSGWTYGREFDNMYKTLQLGIAKNGMAAYEFLPASDRIAIISYVRTLVQLPQVTDDQIKTMDQEYQLSKGMVLPNQIPVSLASDKLISENSDLNERFKKFEGQINKLQNLPGENIFINYSVDCKKVFISFSNVSYSKSFENYVSVVLANPVNSGFNPSVARLSKEEWKLLYIYLKSTTI